jgi:hypothetical protein
VGGRERIDEMILAVRVKSMVSTSDVAMNTPGIGG